MNREFLESLGLEKEQVEKVMAEHGKSVQQAKQESEEVQTEVATLKEQLEERDADIKDLRSKGGMSEELNKQLEDLQEKYKQDTESLNTKLQQTKLDSAIELALMGEKARNSKAVRALLDKESLELSDDGVKGLNEQLEAVKKDNPFLFEEDQGLGRPRFSRDGNPKNNGSNVSAFDAIAEKYTK